MWASGATIEPEAADGEPLQGEGVKQVLQWARDMIAAGNVHEDARAETGETFHLRFGSGKIGMMGTGNFNITLVQEQNPEMDFGVTLLPGVETGQVASFAGGDIVTGAATGPAGSRSIAAATAATASGRTRMPRTAWVRSTPSPSVR